MKLVYPVGIFVMMIELK